MAVTIDKFFGPMNHKHKATDISVLDAGGYYTGTNVESVLQEIGAGTASIGYVKKSGDTMTGALTVYNGTDAIKSGAYPFYTKSYNVGSYVEPTLNDYGTMQFYYKMNDGAGAPISTGTAGLVSMWKFDDASGSVLDDAVGSNNGTITGATWNTYGQCQYTGDTSLSFSGVNNVDLGDFSACEGLTTATMMGWAFKTDVTSGGTLFRKISSSTSSYGAYLANVGGMKFVVELRNGAASYATWDFAGVIRNGEWFHWAVCYDGNGATNADKLKLYINGVQRTLTFTLAVGSTTPANTANMYFGYDSSTGTWGGVLDQMSFFNTNEAANIATYYSTEVGSRVTDSTANANYGYLGRGSTSGVPPVWTTDPSGVAEEALDFVTGKVAVGTAWRPTSSFTICTVMKFDNLFTGDATKYPSIFANWVYTSGANQDGFWLRYNYGGDNNLSFYATNGGATAVTVSASHSSCGLNTTDWFHIACRFDDTANTITIWVNGVQKATAAFNTAVGYNGNEIFTIGGLNFPYTLANAVNYEADAKFAWVAAYAEALTDAEILAQAQTTLGTGYTTHIHDTNSTLLAPAKHTSWKNAGTEKAFLDYAGQIYTPALLDSNANEVIKLVTTASAVNELTVTNADTGNNISLSATGDDTNIGITLTPKGTGQVIVPDGAVATPSIGFAGQIGTGFFRGGSAIISVAVAGQTVMSFQNTGLRFNTSAASQIIDTNSNEWIKFTSTASAVNEFTIANAATGASPTLSATGGDTNIDINLVPKGTGGVVIPGGSLTGLGLKFSGTTTGIYAGATGIHYVVGGTLTNSMTTSGIVLRNTGGYKVLDANLNELVQYSSTSASAVNHLMFSNGATSVSPILSATGDDTNIGIDYINKGTGIHRFKNLGTGAVMKVWGSGGSSSSIQFAYGAGETSAAFLATSSGLAEFKNPSAGKTGIAFGIPATGTPSTNYPKISFGTTGNPVTFEALGDDTDIGITLTPKGAGVVTIATDLTVTGATTLNGNGTFGDASTDTYTFTGRMIVRTVNDAGPMTATNGTVAEIVFNSSDSKFYGCTATGTPATWAALN